MLEGCPLCVARKWVPQRARAQGRAPYTSIAPYAAAQATPPPHSRYQRHPCSMTMAGSLGLMPFAFFTAISRLRGVMDRFSGFFAEGDDWMTMADNS